MYNKVFALLIRGLALIDLIDICVNILIIISRQNAACLSFNVAVIYKERYLSLRT